MCLLFLSWHCQRTMANAYAWASYTSRESRRWPGNKPKSGRKDDPLRKALIFFVHIAHAVISDVTHYAAFSSIFNSSFYRLIMKKTNLLRNLGQKPILSHHSRTVVQCREYYTSITLLQFFIFFEWFWYLYPLP